MEMICTKVRGITPEFAWKDWGNPWKKLMTISTPPEIRSHHLWNSNQKRRLLPPVWSGMFICKQLWYHYPLCLHIYSSLQTMHLTFSVNLAPRHIIITHAIRTHVSNISWNLHISVYLMPFPIHYQNGCTIPNSVSCGPGLIWWAAVFSQLLKLGEVCSVLWKLWIKQITS